MMCNGLCQQGRIECRQKCKPEPLGKQLIVALALVMLCAIIGLHLAKHWASGGVA